MLTLAAGIPPISRAAWWHGKEAQCPECKTRVKLEPGDEQNGAISFDSATVLQIKCPLAGCEAQFPLEKINPPFGETPP